VLLICYHPVTISGSTLDSEAKELVSSLSCASFACLASVWVLLIRCHPVTLMCATRGRDLSQITHIHCIHAFDLLPSSSRKMIHGLLCWGVTCIWVMTYTTMTTTALLTMACLSLMPLRAIRSPIWNEPAIAAWRSPRKLSPEVPEDASSAKLLKSHVIASPFDKHTPDLMAPGTECWSCVACQSLCIDGGETSFQDALRFVSSSGGNFRETVDARETRIRIRWPDK
jgi:hypothetical protein